VTTRGLSIDDPRTTDPGNWLGSPDKPGMLEAWQWHFRCMGEDSATMSDSLFAE
jgi:hypothetical protein